MLDKKYALSGFSSMGAFIRKMVLTGYVLKIDLEPINKLLSLTSTLSNNVNQLAKKANSYEAITHEDMREIRNAVKEVHSANKLLLDKIAEF